MMRFTTFREYDDKFRKMTGVHEKEALIRELLGECEDLSERVIAAMLLVGRLSQPHEGLTTGIKEAFIANDLGLEGRQSLEDLGIVAMERAEVGMNDYTIGDVWAIFRSYLESTGRKSADKTKIINIVMFQMAAEKEDVPLLLRILCEKVNNGIDEKTVLYAIDNGENSREEISRSFAMNPNLAIWVTKFLEPDEPFVTATATVGIALNPQLCERVKKVEDVIKEHKGSTIVQLKLDGVRIHIHVWIDNRDGLISRQCKIFTRKLKDITKQYPEIVAAVEKLHIQQHAILDGELVALDAEGNIGPFSLLQKRLGRKEDHDVVQVGVVLYDVLLWDDAALTTMGYWARLELLKDNVRLQRFKVIESTTVKRAEQITEMLLQAAEDGEEGLVCKYPMALPAPGQRNKEWIKLKPDYMASDFPDTYDLVVIGYTKGRGRRHGKIGALWVAIRDADRPQLWPVCKVGTGLKDEDLDWFQENLRPMGSPSDQVAGLGKPPEVDVWVQPDVVIEMGATGGMTKIDKWAGFSLRFPYFLQVREDKGPEQATSTAEVTVP